MEVKNVSDEKIKDIKIRIEKERIIGKIKLSVEIIVEGIETFFRIK